MQRHRGTIVLGVFEEQPEPVRLQDLGGTLGIRERMLLPPGVSNGRAGAGHTVGA